jgi:hypothetical protein
VALCGTIDAARGQKGSAEAKTLHVQRQRKHSDAEDRPSVRWLFHDGEAHTQPSSRRQVEGLFGGVLAKCLCGRVVGDWVEIEPTSKVRPSNAPANSRDSVVERSA